MVVKITKKKSLAFFRPIPGIIAIFCPNFSHQQNTRGIYCRDLNYSVSDVKILIDCYLQLKNLFYLSRYRDNSYRLFSMVFAIRVSYSYKVV